MTRTALYRQFNCDGALLYVGVANDPAARLQQHMRTSGWGSQIASVAIEWHADRDTAEMAEWAAIQSEDPMHNTKRTVHPPKQRPTAPRWAKTQNSIVAEIDAFLAQTGMGQTYFGKASVGNSEIVARLRVGGRLWPETAGKIREFIRARQPAVISEVV